MSRREELPASEGSSVGMEVLVMTSSGSPSSGTGRGPARTMLENANRVRMKIFMLGGCSSVRTTTGQGSAHNSGSKVEAWGGILISFGLQVTLI